MASEECFQNKFIKPLIECYGIQKFPQIRIQKIWERVKILPDHVISKITDRIIVNFDNFPGVQAILNTCAEVGAEFYADEQENLKKKIDCKICSSQGVVVVNSYAYKCACQLGQILYPCYPLYRGQQKTPETITFESDGTRVFEDANYISYVPAGCKNIKEIKTIIKNFNSAR